MCTDKYIFAEYFSDGFPDSDVDSVVCICLVEVESLMKIPRTGVRKPDAMNPDDYLYSKGLVHYWT